MEALKLVRDTRPPLDLARLNAALAGADAEEMRPFVHLLQDELNVKSVEFASDIEAYGSFRLQIDARSLGPKLGRQMKDVLAATRSGDWKIVGDRAEIAGVTLEAGDFVLQLEPKEGITAAALSTNDVVLALDTEVTPELEQEGLARDFVRLVQQARKDAGLHVSDRIALWVDAGEDVTVTLRTHQGYIKEQVLALEFGFGAAPGDAFVAEGKVGGGASVRLALQKH